MLSKIIKIGTNQSTANGAPRAVRPTRQISTCPRRSTLQILAEIGNFPSVPVSFCLCFLGRISKMKAFRNAFRYASRLQSLVEPVHAVIAFDCFAGFRIPLGGPPGTGRDTGFAADAQCFVNEYDAVLGPFLHRTGGAGRDTPRLLAVKAGHEYVRHAWQVV